MIFLDFEASALLPGSYPIQVGWCDEDGIGEEHLIRPEIGWTEWDYNSQQIHGITQGDLAIKGVPAADVARRVIAALAGHEVYSDAPGWDGGWLDTLLEVGDYPPDAVRLIGVGQAYGVECRRLLPTFDGDQDVLRQRMLDIVRSAQVDEERDHGRRHCALADAQSLWRTWIEVRRRVDEALRT